MARYSAFKYGAGIKYGTSNDVAYSVAPFDVLTLDYNEVFLTWKEPLNPDSGDGQWSRIRVLRNQYDVPETPEDGVILYDDVPGAAGQKFYIDGSGTGTKDVYYTGIPDLLKASGFTATAQYLNPTKPLTQGRITYYAIWILQVPVSGNRSWELVAVADTVIAKNHSTILSNTDDTPLVSKPKTRTRTTHEKILDILPKVYTSSSESPTDPSEANSDLSLFLEGFSYTLDEFMTYTDLLLPSHTAENYSPQRLATQAFDFDISPNNSDFTSSQRRLIRESRRIASLRGTVSGAETGIEALTGYNTEITNLPNIMLSNQDSTFRGGVGLWKTLGNATVTATKAVLPPQKTFVATAISGNGTTITYTCSNNLIAGEVVTITSATTAGYNLTSATVASATSSQFTVTNSATGASSAAIVTHDANSTDLATALDFTWCAKVTVTTAGARLISGINKPLTEGTPVTAGTSYTLSYYAKDDGSGTSTVSILWYDYTGTLLSTSSAAAQSYTAGWVKYSTTATAPANAVFAGFDISFSDAANYYFDNFQFAVSTVSTYNEARGVNVYLSPKKVNLIKNPSFEDTVTGWTATSTSYQTSVPPGLISGAKSLQATVNNSSKKITADTSSGIASVTPGKHYTFSIYCQTSTGTGAMTLSLSAASSGKTTLTSTTPFTATTTWARQFVTLYIPDDYASPTVTVEVAGPASDTVVMVDAAQLEAKYLPTDYFDGSVPDGTWATANNSPSYWYPNRDLMLSRLFMDIKTFLPINTPYIVRLDTDTDPIATVNGTNIAGYTG